MELNEIKSVMLNEYEKQLNELVNKFSLNGLANDFIKNVNYLNNRYNFFRVDIKNYGNSTNDVEFLEYGKDMTMYKPGWFKDELGIGSKLESDKENMEFIFKCINSGMLKIYLRGIDFRDFNNVRIPIYINLTKLLVNEEVIFNRNCLIWHDSPYIFEKECQNQQYFQIKLEFKTLFDYFPVLNFQLSEDVEINTFCEKINNYISMEKSILR